MPTGLLGELRVSTKNPMTINVQQVMADVHCFDDQEVGSSWTGSIEEETKIPVIASSPVLNHWLCLQLSLRV